MTGVWVLTNGTVRSVMLMLGLSALVPAFAVAESALGFSDFFLGQIRSTYGSEAERRVQRWDELVVGLQGQDDLVQVEAVNRFFNQVRFLDDEVHWQRTDYWATPVELLATNGGDCEDFAIAKYFTLKELGVPASKMRLTYVKAMELNQAHMVLTYYREQGKPPLVLDNLTDRIMSASERRDLVPVTVLTGTACGRQNNRVIPAWAVPMTL